MSKGNGELVVEPLNYREITRRLIDALGPTLVAALAGSKDRTAPHEWAKVDGSEPSPEALPRLACAYETWTLLAAADGDRIARQWFIGGNPHLNENTPITAIREDRHGDVANAVESFIAGPADA
ncbi:MAG: hypothetical protein ACYC2K_17370 [Gemmatimonadales bacterium]